MVPGKQYTVLVPSVDRDGNDIPGVRAPMVAAPLGTYTGWNLRARGHGVGAQLRFEGSYIPFAESAQFSDYLVLDLSRPRPDGDFPVLYVPHDVADGGRQGRGAETARSLVAKGNGSSWRGVPDRRLGAGRMTDRVHTCQPGPSQNCIQAGRCARSTATSAGGACSSSTRTCRPSGRANVAS